MYKKLLQSTLGLIFCLWLAGNTHAYKPNGKIAAFDPREIYAGLSITESPTTTELLNDYFLQITNEQNIAVILRKAAYVNPDLIITENVIQGLKSQTPPKLLVLS
jgi:hypothetical protein